MSNNQTEPKTYFTKTPENNLLFKKRIINTYLEVLDSDDFPPQNKTLALDFENMKASYITQQQTSSYESNFSRYLDYYVDTHNRTFKVTATKGVYILFKEDISYLLTNHPKFASSDMILSFIAPRFIPYTLKNEVSKKNIYTLQLLCRKTVYTKSLLQYYKKHQSRPTCIVKLGTTLVLTFTNKAKYDIICEELNKYKSYDRSFFDTLLTGDKKKTEVYIDFIIDNYRRIHKIK